jgi:tetratricopeptide (TPR) repeat protein
MSKRLGLAAMAALAACLIGAAESALAQGRGRAGEGAGVGAQSAAADSARLACSAAVRSQREAEAKAAAKEAERLYRRLIAARPKDPEPRVQLAQVLSICKIPYADFLGQGRILSQANKLLEEALALDPSHWSARYTLAMNHYSTPAFLGRTEAAIREFELLLEQQGDRADSPQLAVPYIYLGDLYERKKRTEDAQAIWRRGAALFPDDSRLPERLERVREAAGVVRSPGPALPPGAAGRNEPDSAPRAADFVLEPLTAQASVFRLDDTDGGAALGSLDIYTTPGGTADLLQVFQTLPGVTRASEGSDLYIRGGDPAETPVFVDGARLFYAGTFESLHGGIFGVLDPAVLRRAYFSSGGFSARYGDALSGVLDLESEGRPTTRTGRIGLSMVGAGATLRTPLGERVGAWASVRGTHTSLLLRTRSQRQDYPRAPRSIEGTVGVMAAPSHRLELRAVALAEGDASTRTVEYGGYAGDFESEGTTRLALLSARYLTSGGGATWRATAAVTERTSSFAFGVLDRERGDQALSLRLDGDLTRGGLRVRTGLEASTAERSEGGMVPLTDRLDPGALARHIDTTAGGSAHLGAYLEGDWLLGRRLALSAGVRADRLPGEDVWTGDPRLALSARAGNDWVLRLGGGIFHQGRRRVQYRIPDEGTPTGVPRRARHLAASVERIGEPTLRLEAYVK